MDKDILSGLVKLWRFGTPEYRLALILSWSAKDVAEVLKAVGCTTALDLVLSMKESRAE